MPALKTASTEEAFKIMRERGHSYRSAAKIIGVNHTHLYRVLKGKRASARTLAAIEKLPSRI